MIALARWANLKVIHAHTNSAPSLNSHEWFSKDNSDSMLIAKKEYSGKPNFNPISYSCVPLSEKEKHQNFVTFKEYYLSQSNPSDQSNKLTKYNLPKIFMAFTIKSTKFIKKIKRRLFN